MSLIKKKKKSFVKCVSGENDSEFFFVEGGRGRGGGGGGGGGGGEGGARMAQGRERSLFPTPSF